MSTVTLRLTMPQFQEMLQVVLGERIPDGLSNKVLMVCTRPRDGITEVPLEADEVEQIAIELENAGSAPLAALLRAQGGD